MPGGRIFVHRLDPVAALEQAHTLMADDPELGEQEALAEVYADFAEAIRVGLGFPPRGRWVNRPEWDSSLAPGEPHSSVMEKRENADIESLPVVAA